MSKRSFLSPMKPGGTPGEVIEVELVGKEEVSFMAPATLNAKGALVAGQVVTVPVRSAGPGTVAHNAAPEFAPVVPYTTNDIAAARSRVFEAERELEHAKARGLDRTQPLQFRRFEDAFTDAREALDDAEGPRRRERERQRVGGDHAPTGNTQVTNAKKRAAPGSPEAAAGWAKHLADLDAKLAGRIAAPTAS